MIPIRSTLLAVAVGTLAIKYIMAKVKRIVRWITDSGESTSKIQLYIVASIGLRCAGLTIQLLHAAEIPPVSSALAVLWCTTLSHRLFCTKFITPVKFPKLVIGLAKMLLLIRERKLLDRFFITRKLTKL